MLQEQQALKLEPITNLLQRFDAQELAEQTGATDETATDKTKTDNAEYQEAAQKKLKDTASDVLSQLGLNGLIDTASDEIHDIAKEEKKGQDAEKRTSIAKKATAAANARKAEAEKKLAALAGSQASKAPGGASVALDEKDDFVFLPVAQLRTMMAEEVATEDDDTSKVDQNAPFSRMKDLVGSVSGAFSQGGNLKDVVSKGGSSILKAAQQQTVWERERADKAEKALKAAEAEADAAEEKLKQAQSAMPATTTPPARAIPPATATSSSTATTDSSSSGFSLFGGGGGLQMLVEEPASKKDEKKADAAPAKKEEAKKEPTPKIAVVKKEDTAKSNAAKKEEKAGPADDFLNKLPGFLQPLKQFLTPGVGIVNQAAAKIEGFAAPPKDEAKKAKQSTYGIPQAVKNQLSSLPFTAMKGVGGGDSGKTGDNTIQLFQLGSFVPDGVGQFLPSGLAEDGPLRRREYQNNFVVPGAAVPDYMWEPAEESTAHSRVLSLYQPSSSDVISLKAGAPAKGAEGTGAPFRVDLKSDFLRVPSAQFLPLVTYLVGDEGLKHCFASANSIWFCRDNQDMNTALQKKHIQMTIQSDNTNFNIRVTGSQLFFSLSDADGHSIGWNMVLIRGSKSGFLVVPASVFMAKYIVGAASDRTLYVDAAAGTLRMTGAGSVSKSGVSVLFVVIPTLTVLMCLYQLVVSMNEKVVMPEPESKDLHYVRF
ncbi:unnamed protein product [Amoebophrya sp. A25]|nr:unnamed protein product [Amoebophrya sp. A25]|eukprot:GSA25T00023925001.1